MSMFYVLEYKENGEHPNYFLINKTGLRLNGFNAGSVESLVEQASENGIERSQISCLVWRELLQAARERYSESVNPSCIRCVGD